MSRSVSDTATLLKGRLRRPRGGKIGFLMWFGPIRGLSVCCFVSGFDLPRQNNDRTEVTVDVGVRCSGRNGCESLQCFVASVFVPCSIFQWIIAKCWSGAAAVSTNSSCFFVRPVYMESPQNVNTRVCIELGQFDARPH